MTEQQQEVLDSAYEHAIHMNEDSWFEFMVRAASKVTNEPELLVHMWNFNRAEKLVEQAEEVQAVVNQLPKTYSNYNI